MITLYNEIVLADGNTMMEGFPERLIKDTKKPYQMKWNQEHYHQQTEILCLGLMEAP